MGPPRGTVHELGKVEDEQGVGRELDVNRQIEKSARRDDDRQRGARGVESAAEEEEGPAHGAPDEAEEEEQGLVVH